MRKMVDSESVETVVKNSKTEEFLLLKRSSEKDLYPEFWEFPGGSLEDETPVEGAVRELKEETGLEGEIVKGGESFEWQSERINQEIKSYLFLVEVEQKEVELSHEHTKYEWLELQKIFEKKHFPLIEKDLKHAGVQID